MTQAWIAEEQVVFVHPDGRREAGRIAVGLPEQVDDVEARCAVALDGFQARPLLPICGASKLQALLLATQFLGTLLHGFLSRGGRVVDPDEGEDAGLENLFGPLLREPAPSEGAVDD